jgi:hypothetical protein
VMSLVSHLGVLIPLQFRAVLSTAFSRLLNRFSGVARPSGKATRQCQATDGRKPGSPQRTLLSSTPGGNSVYCVLFAPPSHRSTPTLLRSPACGDAYALPDYSPRTEPHNLSKRLVSALGAAKVTHKTSTVAALRRPEAA